MQLPDYKHSILSITNSILQCYNIVPFSQCALLPLILNCANSGNIVLLLFDGMGSASLSELLPSSSILLKNKLYDVSSVYPCTTASATRSFYSGLPPISHGYLGWNSYFKEIGRNVAVLKNRDIYTNEVIEVNTVSSLLSLHNILEKIKEKNIAVHHLMPAFERNGYENLEHLGDAIYSICSNHQRNFIFAYWDLPDLIMHEFGPYSPETRKYLLSVDKFVDNLSARLSNSVLIVTADHGMKAISDCIYINDDHEFLDCLYMPPSLESRSMSLFVKAHKKERFLDIFNNKYGSKYALFKHNDAINKYHLFGEGTIHPKVDDFVGDFIACAVDDTMLLYETPYQQRTSYKGHHAGLTLEELTVPVILVET